MAVFKCKMCGGTLEVNNETVATCSYCGTQQTLPRLDDEKRAQLYDRANYFRRENEFDKAMGIYEMILSEEKTDCEAYWGLVLCRYGIEYVEDPRSHIRIPTVNRAQFTSVLDDEDYKRAVANADSLQKGVYKSEAGVIDKIQKGILAVSSKEEPFDVFICYKETDNFGNRTQDSVYAQDIYNALVKEGYKVFFSRITLEDKLGSAYEPYIFAALQSARVMLVVGTSKDNFNAVWVKNEWSRFISLIKAGKEKTLIPLYKDMSPYDMPEEFQYLQSQDMGKIGYIQDIIHGIKKLIETDVKSKETIIVNTGNAKIESLIKRGYMALEDGDWIKADNFFEQVLNQNAECAEGYLGKLLAELQVKNQNELRTCSDVFDESDNYQKTIRFADKKLKTTLCEITEFIIKRNEESLLKDKYAKAKEIMASAFSEDEFRTAEEIFRSISDYLDSELLADECDEEAENARKEFLYKKGLSRMHNDTLDDYIEAIVFFEKLIGWKDAEQKIEQCQKLIENIEIENELYNKKLAEEERKKLKLRKTIAVVSLVAVVFVIAIYVAVVNVFVPMNKYNNAVSMMEKGQYEEAVALFAELGDYKDSSKKISDCRYYGAIGLMEDGQYAEAIVIFENLSEYRDSATKLEECNIAILDEKYNSALELLETGDYFEAIDVFLMLGDHKDSIEKTEECKELLYDSAVNMLDSASYDDAYSIFEHLGDYEDSQLMMKKTKFLMGEQAFEQGEYIDAIAYYYDAGDYPNAEDMILESKYQYCKETKNNPTADTKLFLQHLISVEYKDSYSMKHDVFAWEADIGIYVSLRVGMQTGVGFAANLIGGDSDGTTVKFVVYTEGETYTYCDEEVYYAGSSVSCQITSLSDITNDYFTVKMYDEDGYLIAEKSGYPEE
jgi:TolA-binding protein